MAAVKKVRGYKVVDIDPTGKNEESHYYVTNSANLPKQDENVKVTAISMLEITKDGVKIWALPISTFESDQYRLDTIERAISKLTPEEKRVLKIY